jgi:hypothetical protein
MWWKHTWIFLIDVKVHNMHSGRHLLLLANMRSDIFRLFSSVENLISIQRAKSRDFILHASWKFLLLPLLLLGTDDLEQHGSTFNLRMLEELHTSRQLKFFVTSTFVTRNRWAWTTWFHIQLIHAGGDFGLNLLRIQRLTDQITVCFYVFIVPSESKVDDMLRTRRLIARGIEILARSVGSFSWNMSSYMSFTGELQFSLLSSNSAKPVPLQSPYLSQCSVGPCTLHRSSVLGHFKLCSLLFHRPFWVLPT